MIAVIDYGIGNIRSVCNALEYIGEVVVPTKDEETLLCADRILLPGVGAFQAGMKKIKEYELDKILHEAVIVRKKPFLGICLGMHLIAKKSYENGECEGLGWINGEVHQFDKVPGFPLPQFGWNNLNKIYQHPLANHIDDNSCVYYANSYHLKVKEQNIVFMTSAYGQQFVASIIKENIFATQFHPEKSQDIGLKILENFCQWNPNAKT